MMWAGALAFLLPLALYTATRAPGLTFVDAGELAAAAATLGIAHPSGYPLFTILGRALVVLPGPLEPFARLSLLSAIWGAGASALTFASIRRILSALGVTRASATASALAASLTLAAGQTVWEQAVIVEVYALHLFLLALLLYLMLVAMGQSAGRWWPPPALVLFGYVAGLAVGNHLSAALLLPAFAYLVVRESGFARLARALPLAVAVFLTGLSIYLYLPVRSALDPMLDWGDPETPVRFFRHATAQVYRVWFLSSAEAAVKQLGRFLALLPVEMTPIALAPAVLGLVFLWRRHVVLAHTTGLLFLLNLVYAINYDIHDIEAYFLPAFLMVAIWVGVGVGIGLDAVVPRLRAPALRRGSRVAAAILLPLLTLGWNVGSASQRDNHLVTDYTAAMFRSLDHRGVILSRQWDHFCSAAIYEQLVRGARRDVTVLEKELLRRSWYLRQLERWDPEILRPCRQLIEEFQAELVPFESGGTHRAEELQRLYVEMINCLLGSAIEDSRPTYLTPDALEPGIASGFTAVPVSLTLRLYREPPAEPPPSPPIEIRGLKDAYASRVGLQRQLAELVLEMGTKRAVYLAAIGRRDESLAAIEAVLAAEPTYARALEVRQAILSQPTGRWPPATPPTTPPPR
jgi:hypothetical protein